MFQSHYLLDVEPCRKLSSLRLAGVGFGTKTLSGHIVGHVALPADTNHRSCVCQSRCLGRPHQIVILVYFLAVSHRGGKVATRHVFWRLLVTPLLRWSRGAFADASAWLASGFDASVFVGEKTSAGCPCLVVRARLKLCMALCSNGWSLV